MSRRAAEMHTRAQPPRAKFFKASQKANYMSQMLLKILHTVHALHALQRVWKSRNAVGATSNSCLSMLKSVPLQVSRCFLSCLKFSDESSVSKDEDPVLCFDLVGSPTLSNIHNRACSIPLVSFHVVNSHTRSNSNPL